MNPLLTRRRFVTTTALTAAGLALGLSARSRAQTAGANERIRIALIGCGDQGRGVLQQFMVLDGIEVVAVCDVDANRLAETVTLVTAEDRPKPAAYKDFRHVIDRKDVDAVIIATPDHWHAIQFIAACEAGKDIYCEKPISHSFVEAKAMLAAARRFKPVVQVGTIQRSMRHFQQAQAYIQEGHLGEISVCRAWYLHPAASSSWFYDLGKQQPTPPPAELDWDMWLGPAPMRGYTPNRVHFNWRWFWDTGGGLMSDWGVHMIDTVMLATKQSDPISVAAHGGVFVRRDDRETPDAMQAIYRFPNFLLQWEHRLMNSRGIDGGRSHGAEFIGTKGTLIVDRDGYMHFPEDPKDTSGKPPRALVHMPNLHCQNFVDCMKSRGKPVSDIESMAKTTMICHLGNIALRTDRTLHWDKENWDIKERREAGSCSSYQREYRGPWKLNWHQA